jgi:threonine dehydrogenase-like Zn-dependent dehydrogenase
MRAVVLREPRKLELMDVPKPAMTEPEHVLVKVEACGICGSDLRYWAGENPWAQHTLGRHVPSPPNVILGHELAGVVVGVNDAQHEHLLDRRVGVQAFRTCGVCELCTTGHENLCRDTQHIGHAQGWGDREFFPGGYAEYCLAWADLLHPMEEHITFEEEAMRDVLAVAVHAVGRANLTAGGTVLCIGGGPAGLAVAQVAQAAGAGRIFISEPSPLAQKVIAHYDAYTLIDPTRSSLAGGLAEAAGAVRCAAIFDTVGTAAITAEALPLLAPDGTYVNLAVHDTPLHLNAMDLGLERRMTSSSNAYYRDEREAHRMIAAGAVQLKPMITHRFPLDAYKLAYDLLLADPKQAYKVMFTDFD